MAVVRKIHTAKPTADQGQRYFVYGPCGKVGTVWATDYEQAMMKATEAFGTHAQRLKLDRFNVAH